MPANRAGVGSSGPHGGLGPGRGSPSGGGGRAGGGGGNVGSNVGSMSRGGPYGQMNRSSLGGPRSMGTVADAHASRAVHGALGGGQRGRGSLGGTRPMGTIDAAHKSRGIMGATGGAIDAGETDFGGWLAKAFTPLGEYALTADAIKKLADLGKPVPRGAVWGADPIAALAGLAGMASGFPGAGMATGAIGGQISNQLGRPAGIIGQGGWWGGGDIQSAGTGFLGSGWGGPSGPRNASLGGGNLGPSTPGGPRSPYGGGRLPGNGTRGSNPLMARHRTPLAAAMA